MGGPGSGRWGSNRRKAEQMLCLDISQLRRRGLSRAAVMQVGWPSGASISIVVSATRLRLAYRTCSSKEESQKVEELLTLVTTPTQFGGERQWFQCPTCNRRCRVLYGGNLDGGGRFRCRHCHRLHYSSQVETKASRALRGMLKIAKRLDAQNGNSAFPAKPKGMHWRTYERLAERYARLDAVYADEETRFHIKL